MPAPNQPTSGPWWRHWWVAVVGVVVLLASLGAIAGAGETEEAASRSTSPDVGEPDDASISSEARGTLSNPFPIGDAATFTVRAIGDADYSVWSLVVDEPGTDITQLVVSENVFNPAPDEGSLFFGVPVSLTLVDAGKEPLDTFWNIDFEAVGKASKSVSDVGFFGCGVVPGGFDRNQQVFIGGTLSGVMCFEVSREDFEAGVVLTVDERDRVFLDAGPAEGSNTSDELADADDSEANASGSDDTSRSPSAPEDAQSPPETEADPGSFRSESRFGSYVWKGTILGYTIESANSLSDDDVVACVNVFGNVSPEVAEDYGLTSGGSTPELSLLVDGLLVESSIFGCDNELVTDAGYSTLFLEQMTAGSQFPFFESFELPGGLAEPSAVEVIVGDTDSNDYQRIKAAQFDTVPAGSFVGAPLPLDSVQPAGTVISHYDSESDWDVLVEGVVVLDAVGRRGGGSCIIVVGTMTPTDTRGALVTDGSSTPSVSIVVGGRSRSSDFGGCQDDAAEQAGYGDPDDADVAAGTNYHFYDATYLPPSVAADVEAVSIGLAMFDDVMLVEAPVLSSIPGAQP
jgi:hypothetical protein